MCIAFTGSILFHGAGNLNANLTKLMDTCGEPIDAVDMKSFEWTDRAIVAQVTQDFPRLRFESEQLEEVLFLISSSHSCGIFPLSAHRKPCVSAHWDTVVLLPG